MCVIPKMEKENYGFKAKSIVEGKEGKGFQKVRKPRPQITHLASLKYGHTDTLSLVCYLSSQIKRRGELLPLEWEGEEGEGIY